MPDPIPDPIERDLHDRWQRAERASAWAEQIAITAEGLALAAERAADAAEKGAEIALQSLGVAHERYRRYRDEQRPATG